MARSNLPAPVLEWSPQHVTLFDPATNSFHSGRSITDLETYLSGKKNVIVALSRRTAFLKSIRVPNVGKPEVVQSLKYQVAQHVPLTAEETAYDVILTEDLDTEGRRAILCAARTNKLREIHAGLQRIGAAAQGVTLAALGAAFVASDAGAKDAEVVQDTAEGLAIDVVSGGFVVASRVVAPGEVDLHAEIYRACTLAGRTPQFGIGAGGYEGPGLGSQGESNLAALARHGLAGILLEPPEAQAARSQQSLRRRQRLVAILAAACLGMGFYVWDEYQTKANEIRDLASNYQKRRTEAQNQVQQVTLQLASLEKKREVLDEAFEPAQPFGDVLTVVAQISPTGLWFTGVNLERGKPLILRGTAMNDAAVKGFLDALAADDRFREVKLVFANEATIEETPVVQFSVSAHVVGNLPIFERTRARR